MKVSFVASFIFSFCFQILIGQTNACLESQSFRVVVLGSSTAAGSGVSTPDSAWVNKYRNYVQGINPLNEVINLAVGGFNTYKIMPSNFVPPANRPVADTNKNITKALSLNPDAIIVNLPSNDISSGYSVSEQLFNLDSIYSLSNQNNIPIWICTTQPVNYGSSAQRQLQEDLKDSIQLIYGSFSINFWDTIALPDNSINPIYNTDGTHLNDAGHSILVSRVIDAQILQYLYSSVNYTDFWCKKIISQNANKCGDTLNKFDVVVANIGTNTSFPTKVFFELFHDVNGSIYLDSITINSSINSCDYDTVSFYANTSNKGSYVAEASVRNIYDSILTNDTSSTVFQTIGHPVLNSLNDTLCTNGEAEFVVDTTINDHVYWYQNVNDTVAILTGSSFQTPVIDTTSHWYVETIRGDLFYSNILETTSSSNIDWNGVMFDLVADENIIVDSFDVKFASLGSQMVEIYFKSGSYIGSEAVSSVWTVLGSSLVNVLSVDDFTSVNVGSLNITLSDTVGIYIQLVDPSLRLSYHSIATPIMRSTSELSIISGSGISHNFSGSYYPRDWNGRVHYHFGDRPNGECKTERVKATAWVSTTEINIGADTIIDIADTILLQGPSGMNSYLWSTGSTNQNITVVASDLGKGIHFVDLQVEDSLTCLISDEIVLGVANLVSVNEIGESPLNVYPNPTSGTITINTNNVERIGIYSLSGMELLTTRNSSNIDISTLNSGIYILKVRMNGSEYITQIIKE